MNFLLFYLKFSFFVTLPYNVLQATVTITGPNDSPVVSLSNSHFEFAETAGTVDISVRLTKSLF